MATTIRPPNRVGHLIPALISDQKQFAAAAIKPPIANPDCNCKIVLLLPHYKLKHHLLE